MRDVFMTITSQSQSKPDATTLESTTVNSSTAQTVPKRCLLTWFTTFKQETARDSIQSSVIVNRAKLMSTNDEQWVTQPVLFLTNETRDFEENARKSGWHVYDVSRFNEFGTPFIRDMVDVIMKSPYDKSAFFGFANGDMLFDQSLLATLKLLATNASSSGQSEQPTLPLKTPMLIIGMRTTCITSPYWSKHEVIVNDLSYVEQLRRNCKLGLIDMIDYFIFTADFPREFFDGLVIARPGYDNYLVAASIRHQVTVIDATNTITAVHLRTPTRVPYSNNIKNTMFNRNKLKGYDYKIGHVKRAPYETNFNVECLCIAVKRRQQFWEGTILKPTP